MDGTNRHFIRRFSRKSDVRRDRTVLPRAFEPRSSESALSFTFRNEELRSQNALIQYRDHFPLTSGDLPGLCWLSHRNLVEDLEPPLPPRYREDTDDKKYGRLHYETDVPGETQQNQMATQATQNGLLLPAVIKKRVHPPESASGPV